MFLWREENLQLTSTQLEEIWCALHCVCLLNTHTTVCLMRVPLGQRVRRCKQHCPATWHHMHTAAQRCNTQSHMQRHWRQMSLRTRPPSLFFEMATATKSDFAIICLQALNVFIEQCCSHV